MNEENIEAFYTYLQSQQTAQKFLLHCYEQIEIIDPELKSYENCNSFLYYLKHGLHFYETGKKLTTILQPILFFYGMIHLIKASLLTKRPDYPETTKLLAHGVSSRKRKKKGYTFMEDEVTIHNNGLYSYFSEHLSGIKGSSINKFKMKDLLIFIPEMSSLFMLHKQEEMSMVGKLHTNSLTFPTHLLDDYYLTAQAFLQRIDPYLPKVIHTDINQQHIQVQLSSPITKSSGPFFFHTTHQTVYFPTNRRLFLSISEIMVHYLLLYNLSMLSRYETEWWGDLLTDKADIDFPFIKHFLHHTVKKIPLLLGYDMYQDYLKI